MARPFQTFDVKSNPSDAAPRVAALREELTKNNLDGFLVPRADEHQGEYVPPRAQRLTWLTGFTGSAGAALILKKQAYIFVDGRYELQVQVQTDPAIFSYENLVTNPPATLLANYDQKQIIGFDPWLHTISDAKNLRNALEKQNGQLIAVTYNLVDAIWHDQPAAPLGEVTIQPLQYAGQEAREKIAQMQQALKAANAYATVLTDPSSIAWVFNIRGKDISNTPLPLCFAIIYADKRPDIFIDEKKLSIEPRAYLTQLADLHAPNELEKTLRNVSSDQNKIMLDPALAADKLRMIVEDAGGAVIHGADPARLPRAIKNAAELKGSRDAHVRDGVAVTKFLAWADAQKPGTLDEIKATSQLEEIRAQTGDKFQMPLLDVSFDTIAGAGPNGAMMHYRVNTESNRIAENGDLFLIDSGAQYRDGTTDITRTFAVGDVPADRKRYYTLVLKGMIAISLARFPVGTRGQDIDALARIALWKHGLDYAHGTGHGIGSYLSVHEGPQNISKRGTQELFPGMILSNEPGYYKQGAFGIRLENLVIVTEPEIPEGGDLPMMGFETVTFCPFDRRLIDKSLLTSEELNWLNQYHEQVRIKLEPHLEGEERDWLISATKAL